MTDCWCAHVASLRVQARPTWSLGVPCKGLEPRYLWLGIRLLRALFQASLKGGLTRSLTAALALLSTLLVTMAGAGIWGMTRSQRSIRTVFSDRVVPLTQIHAISDSYSQGGLVTAHQVIQGTLTP